MTLIHDCMFKLGWRRSVFSSSLSNFEIVCACRNLWQVMVDNNYTLKLHDFIIYGQLCKWAIQTESCVVICWWARWNYLAYPGLLAVSFEKQILFWIPYNTCKSYIDQTFLFKMPEYECVYVPWLHLGPYICKQLKIVSTEQAWSIGQ